MGKEYIQKAVEMIMEYGPKVLLAVVVLLVGFAIANKLVKISNKLMEKRGTDASLRPFITGLINILLKALILISVADMVGIATTSFVAIIGAAGLAVGFALQGTLANFAGGVLILIFKPYRVGDLIEAQGHTGHVTEIQIFVSTLITPDNKTIIIPNGTISNGSIINYSKEGKIRIDLTMGIAYGANIKDARNALMEAMQNHPKVLKDPAPFVGVGELGDSSVNLAVRPYCEPDDYWDVYFDIYEAGKNALDANNIEIPFPQVDVHLDK